MKPGFLFLIALCLVVPGCVPAPAGPEKVMLAVQCGWQTVGNFGPGAQEGRLIITDITDGSEERHEYTGIKSPVWGAPSGDTVICLWRNDLAGTYLPAEMQVVSAAVDYDWLSNAFAGLEFSTVKNTRRETEARVVAIIYEKAGDEWHKVKAYWICADGTVLKEGSEDGHTCFYESLGRIADYYYISALQVKYEGGDHPVYLSCFSTEKPEKYRLCISSKNGHRDLTLAEARDLFAGLENSIALTGRINPDPPSDLESYLKLTEYISPLNDGQIESATYYLSPEGKLTTFRDTFGFQYWDESWELFEGLFLQESESVLNYDVVLKLLAD